MMRSTVIYGIIVIFACVDPAPLGEVDPNSEEIDQMVYFGALKDGGSVEPSKFLWWVGKRRLVGPNGSGLVTAAEGTEVPTSSSATAAPKLTENTSEVPKLDSSPISDFTMATRSTFSPLQVHYDDYNYPSLKS
ncbi:hypothetical protein TcWFU_008922 [Taenia crassiceps]|uniref:Uncharacterized protein n=1 Tax=Taenia crassiceps TaxID=6207 RepID=A0ABR4QMJ0_9CEST